MLKNMSCKVHQRCKVIQAVMRRLNARRGNVKDALVEGLAWLPPATESWETLQKSSPTPVRCDGRAGTLPCIASACSDENLTTPGAVCSSGKYSDRSHEP